eukprot:scaffold25167_cov54-Phaeocystis_antarctica.AAC.2
MAASPVGAYSPGSQFCWPAFTAAPHLDGMERTRGREDEQRREDEEKTALREWSRPRRREGVKSNEGQHAGGAEDRLRFGPASGFLYDGLTVGGSGSGAGRLTHGRLLGPGWSRPGSRRPPTDEDRGLYHCRLPQMPDPARCFLFGRSQ